MQGYHILDRIGEGSFGKVYKGRRKFTGQIVALKFISKKGKNGIEMNNLRDELKILKRLNHPNIITMLDSFEEKNEFCVVTEYAQGDLFQVLEDDKVLPVHQVKRIGIQLVSALYYLHEHRIIHRDMKPQNILIGSKEQVKLCDFGFARAMSQQTSVLTSIKGTPLYMAPELVKEQPYNHAVDLWSLGVILYELAVGKPPFFTNSICSLVHLIVQDPVQYPKHLPSELVHFLQGLLTKEPKYRLNWPELMSHPFLKETKQDKMERMALHDLANKLPRYFVEQNEYSDRMENAPPKDIVAHALSVTGTPQGKLWKENALNPAVNTSMESIGSNNVHHGQNVGENANLKERPKEKDLYHIWQKYTQSSANALIDDEMFYMHVERAINNDMGYVHVAIDCIDKIVELGVMNRRLRLLYTKYCTAMEVKRDNRLVPGMIRMLHWWKGMKVDVPPLNGNQLINVACESLAMNQQQTEIQCWLELLDCVFSINPIFIYERAIEQDVISILYNVLDQNELATMLLAKIVCVDRKTIRFPLQCIDSPSTIDEKHVYVKGAIQIRATLQKRLALQFEQAKKCHVALSFTSNSMHLNQPMVIPRLQIMLQACRSSSLYSKYIVQNPVLTNLINAAQDIIFVNIDVSMEYTIYQIVEIIATLSQQNLLQTSMRATCLTWVQPLMATASTPIIYATCTFLADVMSKDPSAHVDLKSLHLLSAENVNASKIINFGVPIGILDPCLLLLYTSCEASAENLKFVLSSAIWKNVCNILAQGGSGNLSPWGLNHLLKFTHSVLENASVDASSKISLLMAHEFMASLTRLLCPQHVEALLNWPQEVGGGYEAVKIVLHYVCTIASMAFRYCQNSPNACLQNICRTMERTNCVPNMLRAFAKLCIIKIASFKDLPLDFISDLSLASIQLTTEFIEGNGIALLKKCQVLSSTNPKVADAIMIISRIARETKSSYDFIHRSNFYAEFRNLLQHEDAIVRARAGNCIGNLCRHSAYFYPYLVSEVEPRLPIHNLSNLPSSSVLYHLIACCSDDNDMVRRFACFAIGNAAFYSAELYPALVHAIPGLLKAIHDDEEKTRMNAMGAIGNLVRNSAELCDALLAASVPIAIFSVAKDEDSIAVQRVAYHSLGNFCAISSMVDQLKSTFRFEEEIRFASVANRDDVCRHYISRIQERLS